MGWSKDLLEFTFVAALEYIIHLEDIKVDSNWPGPDI